MGDSYRAFISYSHADARQAKRLHARLESYRLPRSLGHVGSAHKPDARLGPIFRDRDDLAAAQDLSDAVKRALHGSDVLVVICSPNARASRWVGREITLFRELHPDGQILAAIIDGEPHEAIPDELLAMGEPAAADLRKGSDGQRLGFLKIVAGIAGVPLDALAQRDAQRKLRRVMAVTLVSLVAVIAMGIMTYLAIQSRNEATRQRAEAEGLVEFMLTDLRNKLDDAGRLDLLTIANERALAYYSAQDLDRLDPGSLALRAQLLHARGEDLDLAGDLAGAVEAFAEAAETTRAQLARDPDKAALIYADAQSHFWSGYAAWRQMQLGPATDAFERYRDQSNRLLALTPGDSDALMEAGYAASNLATVLFHTKGKAADALALFEEALARFNAVRESDPGNLDLMLEVADAHAWLADAQLASGNVAAARNQRAEQARLLEAMQRADPNNAQYRRAWLGHTVGLARIELEAGNDTAGRALLERYRNMVRDEAQRDPDNANLALLLAAADLRLHMQDETGATGTTGAGQLCSDAVQAADPELALLCGEAGAPMRRSPELTRFVCQLDAGALTPLLRLDIEEQRDQLSEQCGG